jgi:cytochrome c-type biogenesis protein CcmE
VALVLNAFQSNLVFFFTPTRSPATRRRATAPSASAGWWRRQRERDKDALTVRFRVTDTAKTIPCVYTGILPDLFKEGKGVVAQGKLGPTASSARARCSPSKTRTTCPPEAAEALKRAGHPLDKSNFSGQKGRRNDSRARATSRSSWRSPSPLRRRCCRSRAPRRTGPR